MTPDRTRAVRPIQGGVASHGRGGQTEVNFVTAIMHTTRRGAARHGPRTDAHTQRSAPARTTAQCPRSPSRPGRSCGPVDPARGYCGLWLSGRRPSARQRPAGATVVRPTRHAAQPISSSMVPRVRSILEKIVITVGSHWEQQAAQRLDPKLESVAFLAELHVNSCEFN